MKPVYAALPFYALYGPLARERRERLVRDVLDFHKRAPAEVRSRFEQRLNDLLRVDGFKRPSKAPAGKLTPEILRHLLCCRGVLEALLDVWVEARAELCEVVAAHLSSHGAALAEVFALEGGDIMGWSPEMLEVISSLKPQAPGVEDDDIALMVCCQTDPSQIRSLSEGKIACGDNGIESEKAGDRAEAGGIETSDAYEPRGRFGAWTRELEGLPPEASEWDEADSFATALTRMAAERRALRNAARDALVRDLVAFVEANSASLHSFGHTSFESWSAEGCPRGEESGASSRLEELGSALARYEEALARPAGSRAEDRERRAALDALEAELELALALLDEKLTLTTLGVAESPRAEEEHSSQGPEERRAPETKEALTRGPDAPSATEDELSSDSASAYENPSVVTDEADEDSQSDGDALPVEDEPSSVAGEQPEAAGAQSAGASGAYAVQHEPVAESIHEVSDLRDTDGLDVSGVVAAPDVDDASEVEEAAGVEEVDERKDAAQAGALREEAEAVAERVYGQPAYAFGLEESAAELAALARTQSGAARCVTLRDLVWRLIYEGRYGLAHHVAVCAKLKASGAVASLPAWLPRAISLGMHVRHSNGDLARVLREDFENFGDGCFVGGASEWDHGLRFLCATAAMRPALLAPETGAAGVLRNLYTGQGLGAFYEWCNRVAGYSDLRHPLDPNALKSVRDAAAWRREMDSLRESVREWTATARKKQMGKFSRATQVWRKWQESGGLLPRLLQYVSQDDPGQLEAARKEVKRLSEDAEIRREIDYVDRQVLKRLIGEDIIAAAFGYLRSHLREAVGLVGEWIALQESRPGREQSFIQRKADELNLYMRTQRETVRAELDAFARQHPSFYVQAGAAACRVAFDNLWTLFDSDAHVSFDEPPARHLLHADLLKATSLRLDHQWGPEAGEPATLDALLELLAAGEVGWQSAFEEYAVARDHEATGRIIEFLAGQGSESADAAAQLRQSRETAVAECLDAQQCVEADARKDVQDAVASGLLREEEQLNFAARIEAAVALADGRDTFRFDESRRLLRGIREEIKLRREGELARVRERLTASPIAPGDPAHARISAVLERGDAATANEYIDRTLNKEQLPDDEQVEGTFAHFFPQSYKAIAEFMEPTAGSARPEWHRVIAELREHARGHRRLPAIGPVEMNVFGKQAERAAEMLEAWFAVKRARAIDRLKARQILTNLGFTMAEDGVALSGPQAGGRAWLKFESEPINDRERCPLPAYGSNVAGRYRVLCVWDRPAEEELLNHVGDTSHGAPVIVFYFARMAEQWRRNLSRLCRQRRRTFVVIDDTLMLYLCGEPEPRLRTLFECALPFTHAEPYTTAAGLVPVEMFYGREQERRSLIDPMGSCFIYGGRQLGKTALLRDVERRFNTQPNKVALWFDLKTHGIGLDKNIDDVWGLLAAELTRAGVMSAASRQLTLDKFLEHVQRWLEDGDERGTRHLLLLLDEADDFLSYDGRDVKGGHGLDGGFVRVERLKGLMEKTHRRFKVVFSGLHNVQRTTRLANHPLAHYGDPLQIGPLLDGGEWREARDLVLRPLAALGYIFQTPDLVMRILWRTNYYPSLIQLYCHHLLKHLTDAGGAAGFDPRSSPPYVITSRHVDDVYYSRDLRKAIRDRLIWTLQLDQRYEVIAYAMALHSLTEGARSMVEGLPVSWVRDTALYWWDEGFSESASEDSVRTLLDEMVGLGILRVVGSNRYALRSTNVVTLMGTYEEIEAALLRDREVPPQYEPATFRAAMRVGSANDDTTAQRSPLTAQQESELRPRAHGVSVVFGCEAAGLLEIAPRMASIFGDEFFLNLDGTTDRAGFERRLTELGEREQGGTTLVLVPTSCPWGAPWVEAAVQRMKKLRSKTGFVRVLFTAGPRRTWQLVGEEAAGFDSMTGEGLTSFSLRPWDDAAVRQWLDECRFPANDLQARARVREVTGNWPLLLYRFYEAVRSNMQAWERGLAELWEELGESSKSRDFAAAWGLDAPVPRRILRDLLGLDWASDEELAGLLEDMPGEVIEGHMRWARRLGLVRLGGGRWQVDATVGRVLAASGD